MTTCGKSVRPRVTKKPLAPIDSPARWRVQVFAIRFLRPWKKGRSGLNVAIRRPLPRQTMVCPPLRSFEIL